MTRVRPLLAGLLALAGASCGHESTSPDSATALVQRYQAAWETHQLSSYVYDFKTIGFTTALDGQTFHLLVVADTVRSAVNLATGESFPQPSLFPSVDQLYDQALAGARTGDLSDIQVDTQLSYPLLLVYKGFPDASGSIVCSNLQPVP